MPSYADYYDQTPRSTPKAPPLTYDSRGPNQGYRDYIMQSYQGMMGSGGYDAEKWRSISQRGASVYGGMQGRQHDRPTASYGGMYGMPYQEMMRRRRRSLTTRSEAADDRNPLPAYSGSPYGGGYGGSYGGMYGGGGPQYGSPGVQEAYMDYSMYLPKQSPMRTY